jgi:hypothetical protein
MGRRVDLTGQEFGRLRALRPTGRSKGKRVIWLCACACGAQAMVQTDRLKGGATRSCGCLRANLARSRFRTHGHAIGRPSPEYITWTEMKARCGNPNNIGFKYYGGRGIRVCDEWLASFEAFYVHVGPRPSPKHSIDRIDVNGDYRAGNVRWATAKEQASNKRPRRPPTAD